MIDNPTKGRGDDKKMIEIPQPLTEKDVRDAISTLQRYKDTSVLVEMRYSGELAEEWMRQITGTPEDQDVVSAMVAAFHVPMVKDAMIESNTVQFISSDGIVRKFKVQKNEQ